MAINAETFTITLGDNLTSTSGTFLDGSITLSSDKNDASNPPAYNTNSKELRLYYNVQGNGCSVTLTTNGVIIKGVQLTASSASYTPDVKYNVDGGSDVQGTWSSTTMTISDIEATKTFKFRNANTSNKQLRIKVIEITYEVSGEDVVKTCSTPVITPASGEITADTEISIECATEDATIRYTIDGTEPSAENGIIYTKSFTLNEDATVKAIAIKDGYNNSAVATATYTLFVSSEYSYELVTSEENGGHYIIVGEKDGNYFAMGAKRDGKNNRESIDVTLDENGAITKPSVKVSEIELQGSEGAWNLYSPNENAYLYNDNGGSNKLILSSESTEMTKATITFNETTAEITFINVTGATADNNGIITQANILQYNSSSNIFSCYKGTQLPVYLYQRVGDVPTGIEDTMVDENAPVEYYNLQGVKVANPENGIFIKKQGGRTSKVVL